MCTTQGVIKSSYAEPKVLRRHAEKKTFTNQNEKIFISRLTTLYVDLNIRVEKLIQRSGRQIEACW